MQEELNARLIRETVNTGGWKLIRQILDEQVASLDSLSGIQNYKQVEARRMAKEAITKFLGALDTITANLDLQDALNRPEPDMIRRAI